MAKTITISYSELASFRQCPHKWMLGYRERWTAPSVSPALSRGSLWHKVLETYYRGVKAGDATGGIQEASKLLLVNDPTDEQELVYWMFEGYLEHWGGADANWKILAVEHNSEIWLPTDRGGRSRFKIKIKVDLIVQDQLGHIWLIDHKSGKDLPSDKELDIDDQFGLYVWGLRQIGKRVFGAIYNAARTQRNKTPGQTLESRFSRTLMNRTQPELDCVAREAYLTARRMYAIPEGVAERAPNPDTCKWKCEFLEPCLAGRKGIDERVFLSEKGFTQNFERH